MSTTYGPIIFPGVGQIVPINISSAATSILIENQSLFDVLFSVSAAQPLLVTQATVAAQIAAGLPITTGGWDLHIGPRMSGVLQIPPDYLTDSPRGKYWTGVMWAQQVNQTNSLVTAGSFISQPGNNIWVTAYGPGEQIPQEGLASIGYFLASQERMLAVPVNPGIPVNTSYLLGATSTWTNVFTTPIANFPFSNPAISAGLITAGQMYAVTYTLNQVMWPLSATAGTVESQHIFVRYAILDVSAVIQATSGPILDEFYAHLSGENQARSVLEFSYPPATLLTVSAGAGPPYSFAIQAWVDSVTGGGGTNIKRMGMNAAFDICALPAGGTAGGSFGLRTGSTYNGFVY